MRLKARLHGLFDPGDGGPVLGGLVPTAAGPLHYLADGPERLPPVVLLHGASGNLLDWTTSILPRLARSRRVIAIDRPGFGASRPVRGPVWLFAHQIRALRAVVHLLGYNRYILVGHSYSGALALDWALRHPDEVAGVVMLGGVAMDWGGKLSGHYRLTAVPGLGRAVARMVPLIANDRLVNRSLEEIFTPQPVPRDYRSRAGVDLALRPVTFRINARAMHSLHAQVAANEPRYGMVLCPVEIVHGKADTIVPPSIHAGPLHRVLPDSGLTLLPEVGHMPHHAAPDAVLKAIRRLGERTGVAGRMPLLGHDPTDQSSGGEPPRRDGVG